MRILFCNIAWMDYYMGIVPGKDEPKNGGSYVKDTKDAHEKYNFKPELLKLKGFPEGEYCLGFVETKSTSAGKRNQLNIEKIEGCSDLKNDTEVDDVLVEAQVGTQVPFVSHVSKRSRAGPIVCE